MGTSQIISLRWFSLTFATIRFNFVGRIVDGAFHMARKPISKEVKRLAAVSLKSLAPGMHHDGDGLYLRKSDEGRTSWILRYMIAGRARDMGLGAYPLFSVAQARERAAEARRQVKLGIDPLEAKHAQRQAKLLETVSTITFQAAAEKYILMRSTEWRGDKQAAQWRASLEDHAYPVLGKLSVQTIDDGKVRRVLEPGWLETTETLSRVRNRIELILDWATAHGYRKPGPNPARWRGHLDKVLPRPRKVAPVEHMDALPYSDVAAFMAELRAIEGPVARALEITILCASRSSEVRGMRWTEIKDGVWTIPAERMKSGKAHRVPLCARALELIAGMPGAHGVGLGKNDMQDLLKALRPGMTTHGFRSTFRDWAGETTSFPRDVIEMALAHTIKNKSEAAYARGDLLEKRRALMDQWATFTFCTTPAAGSVVPFQQKIVAGG